MKRKNNLRSIDSLTYLMILVVTITLISTTLFFISNNVFAQSTYTIASTRGFFNLETGEMLLQPIEEFPKFSDLLNVDNMGCPGEIAVYVHGVWTSEEHAKEQTDRVFLSLSDSGYNKPLIGFSWDSNTTFSLTDRSKSLTGWNIAKRIANESGPLLAQLILDFKNVCENDNVRIIAHSLGSRVTLAALQSLHTNPEWNNQNKPNNQVESVHFLGAAVDNNQISTRSTDCDPNEIQLPCSGEALESEVGRFFNLYNPEDNMLQFVYNNVEDGEALGWCGTGGGLQWFFWWSCLPGNRVHEPVNYNEYSVINQLPPNEDSDNDGECDSRAILSLFSSNEVCTVALVGDNHFGYLGYRSSADTISNNGAIDEVVRDWLQQQ